MRTRFRSLIAAVAVTAAALTGGIVAAAPASAAPPAPAPKPLQRFSLYGETLFTVGDHDSCRGSLAFSFSSPKRGVARLTLRSNGFTGNGPGWQRNPKCRTLVITTHLSGNAFLKETPFTAEFGRKPGEKVSHDIATGSGLVSFGVGTYAIGSPIRLPQSFPLGSYVIVP
ncbi:MAG: enoyl-CoA hydratase [Corynebacteriales bacterium]|nr:enoyl-CoA hydratase [Mycobacteriales bacterium]